MTTEIAPFTPTSSRALVTPKGSETRAALKAKGIKCSKLHNTMTTEIAPFTPTQSRALITPSGIERGTRFLFIGTQTASEIRAALKAKGIKGSELSTKVNDVLRGSATLGQQLAHAFVVEQSKRGIVWEYADALKGSSVLRGKLVKEEPVKPAKAKPAPSIDEAIDSMSEEQAMALVAKLSAKFGA
jgi:hypothetical protein